MANHPSALKRNRQRLKRTQRNRGYRTGVRTQIKRVRAAIEAKDAAKAREALPGAIRAIDHAVTRGVLQKRTASRTISRLTRAVHALSAA